MILLRFVTCLRPLGRPCGNYTRDVLKTIISITLTVGALVFLVFGTLLDQARWDPVKVLDTFNGMLKAIIFDY